MRSTNTGRGLPDRESPPQERPVAELTRLPSGYPAMLEELKTRIRAAQLSAA
jgi:hypothetical protein